jgi:hypothetical protein
MENHIHNLKSYIKYQTCIEKLRQELSEPPSKNYIEHFSFGKTASGLVGDIAKQTDDIASLAAKRLDPNLISKTDLASSLSTQATKTADISTSIAKSDITDVLAKLDTSSSFAKRGSDIATLTEKIDVGDLTKSGTKTGTSASEVVAKLDFGDTAKSGTKTGTSVSESAAKVDVGDLTKSGTKTGTDDIALIGTKNVDVDDISVIAAKSLKSKLDDITNGTKDVGSKAAKKIDNAGDQVKTLYKKAKTFDWESAKKFAKDNKYLLIGGIAIGIIMAVALAKFNEVNNKPLNITKISTDKDSGYIKLEFSPRQTLHEDDTIEITESNSTPQLLGTHNMYDIINDSSLLIKETDVKLVTDGTKGVFVYKTTFGNMLQTVIRDSVSDSVEIANKGILQPLVQGAGDITKDTFATLFSSLFGSLIPPQYSYIALGICIFVSILSSLSSLFSIYKNYNT